MRKHILFDDPLCVLVVLDNHFTEVHKHASLKSGPINSKTFKVVMFKKIKVPGLYYLQALNRMIECEKILLLRDVNQNRDVFITKSKIISRCLAQTSKRWERFPMGFRNFYCSFRHQGEAPNLKYTADKKHLVSDFGSPGSFLMAAPCQSNRYFRATIAIFPWLAAWTASSRSKISVLSAVTDIAVTLQSRKVSIVCKPMTGTSN